MNHQLICIRMSKRNNKYKMLTFYFCFEIACVLNLCVRKMKVKMKVKVHIL